MLTAASRWGLLVLAHVVVVGLIGCSSPEPDSDPESTSTPETPASTEGAGAPSSPAGGGGGSDSGTTTSETTTEEGEGEAGHSHLTPHAGDSQGEAALTQLQGERKFVRMGKLLGCGDANCQTLVIFTDDVFQKSTIEVIDAVEGHLKRVYPLPEPMRDVQLNNGAVMMLDYADPEYGTPTGVYRLELATGKLTREFELASYGRLFRSSSQYLSFTSDDAVEIQVSRLSSPNEAMLTLRRPNKITHLALSDAYVIAADESGDLVAWRLPSGEVVATKQAVAPDWGTVWALTIHDKQVYFGYRRESLGSWHLETGDLRRFPDVVDGGIEDIVVFNNQWIVGHSNGISFFTQTQSDGGASKLELEKTFSLAQPSRIRQIAFAGDTVITRSSTRLQFWDIQVGTEVKKVLDHPTPITAFEISDNQVVGVGKTGMSVWIHIFNMTTGVLSHKLNPHQTPRYPVLAMGDHFLAASSDAHAIGIWNTATGEFVGELQGHADKILAMAISNNVLVSTSGDDTIRLWDLSVKQPIKVITEPSSYIRDLDISGDYIAYRHFEKLLFRNWKTEDPPLIIDFKDDSFEESSVSIIEPWVMTCGPDLVLRVWNLKTGEQVKAFATASTTCALDRSRTDVIRIAGTNGYSVEVFEIDPKTFEGRVLASEKPQKLIPQRTFQVSEPSREFKVHVVDHRSWFRRTWDQIKTWIQKLF